MKIKKSTPGKLIASNSSPATNKIHQKQQETLSSSSKENTETGLDSFSPTAQQDTLLSTNKSQNSNEHDVLRLAELSRHHKETHLTEKLKQLQENIHQKIQDLRSTPFHEQEKPLYQLNLLQRKARNLFKEIRQLKQKRHFANIEIPFVQFDKNSYEKSTLQQRTPLNLQTSVIKTLYRYTQGAALRFQNHQERPEQYPLNYVLEQLSICSPALLLHSLSTSSESNDTEYQSRSDREQTIKPLLSILSTLTS